MSARITRRTVVRGLGAGVAATAITAASVPFIGRKASAGSGQVVISSWGGSFQDAMRAAYFAPFEKVHIPAPWRGLFIWYSQLM